MRSRRYVFVIIVTMGAFYMLPLQYFLPSPSWGSFYSMITAERGVAVERAVSYGPLARHKLDIYRPDNDTGTGPVLLFIYGGSWRDGDRAIYGFLGAAMASQGITTIIPDYRLYPEVMFPSFIEDAAKAYGWVSRNIAAPPGSKNRPVILMGHSAGAHIAALLTLDRHYLRTIDPNMARPAGLIGLAGPMAFDPTTDETTKEVFASVRDADTARPISFAAKDMPPTLLVHGLRDETVGLWNSRKFSERLIKANVKTCKLELADIGHVGVILAFSKLLRWRAPVLRASVKFVRDVESGRIENTDTAC